ncbi:MULTISPECIES: 3-hydroxyacyl-ACP dehydratase FabZ family protein [Streptomyces]|uniref:3-hydroxyacyl-ACP dehydratase FabZ family protein n=1 Tax=Streptomyces TaxID=1883 RepID=UPI00163B77C0|nr:MULTISPECIES: hypothetical protein [Streptomyces]MBC2875752.1 hypothetical protein [Streptomyces sp. TYQ1024]UBI37605.1 hypothetical protein K7I03_14765 [Streptomyces mobaraensis]UKW30193.1 hypothetical protein MCU78_14730 [Streptomyces sp. TYQ1024]
MDPVDSFAVVSPDEVLVRRLVRADDPYLEGHYPEVTVYPGVFLVESVCQAVLHLLWETRGEDLHVEPLRIDALRFTAAFAPGDEIEAGCTCRALTADTLAVTGLVTKGGTKAATVRMTLRVLPGRDAAEEGPDASAA